MQCNYEETKKMVKNRIRVLISAYACEPNKGSEPGVGWNWALQMAKMDEVYVITRSNNRKVIETFLQKHPVEHLHFYYHDCATWKRKMKKLPNGIFVYYKMWQKEILPIARKIVEDEKIDIVHHITFNEFRTPGKLYQLPVPFVWGPIGGGQFYNPIFKDAYFSRKDINKEKLRNFINRFYLIFSSDIKAAVKKANTILIADQSTESIMPKSRKYVRLLETGYDLKRNEVKDYDEDLTINKKRPINAQNKVSLLIVCSAMFVIFYGLQFVIKRCTVLLPFQFIIHVEEVVFIYYITYLFENLESFFIKIKHKTAISKIADSLAKITLEIYLVQMVVIDLCAEHLAFPLSFVVAVVGIYVYAIIVNSISTQVRRIVEKIVIRKKKAKI